MDFPPRTILALVTGAEAYFFANYMGAKYFREMGYDGLYKCSVLAEDELGTVFNEDERAGLRGKLDLSATRTRSFATSAATTS